MNTNTNPQYRTTVAAVEAKTRAEAGARDSVRTVERPAMVSRTIGNKHRRLRSQEGMTLVELLVVIAIAGILVASGTDLMVSWFNDLARTGQMIDRDSNGVALLSYMSTQLDGVEGPLGVADGDETNPLSIAGDQLVFQQSGICKRILFIKRVKQVRAAHAASCSDPKVVPVRGPNEPPADDDNGDGFAEPGDPDFDPAIDSAAPEWQTLCETECSNSSFLVAQGVVSPNEAAQAGADTNSTQLFTYVVNTGDSLAPVDAEASSNSSASWYADRSKAETLLAVDTHACVEIITGGKARCFVPRTTYIASAEGGGAGE